MHVIFPRYFLLVVGIAAFVGSIGAKAPKVMAAGQFAVVTDTAKIRTVADANSTPAQCRLVSVGMNHEHLYNTTGWVNDKGDGWRFEKNVPAAPKGAVFEILAATGEPVKIGSWTNHWYKVKTTLGALQVDKTNAFIECDEGELWIFGEFLKATPKSFKKVKIPAHPGGG